MRVSLFAIFTLGAAALATVGGCASDGNGSAANGQLQPADFRAAPGDHGTRAHATAVAGNGDGDAAPGAAVDASLSPAPVAPTALPGPIDSESSGAGAGTRGERELIVDAMVGQVNGKPIYASEIFRSIGEEVLERLGRDKPRLAFQQDASELIISELRNRVSNAVILAEAERTLTEQQQLGLLGYAKQQREEIISRYGGGVPAVAEQELLARTGRTLEQEVEIRRQKLLIDKYLSDKIKPKVVVRRQEVERHYHDKYEEFNPPPSIEVRVIIVPDESTAKVVDAALAGGASFESVASQYSGFRRAEGGLQSSSGKLEDFKELAFETLNERVRRLGEGEQTGRIPFERGFAFLKLEKHESGEARSLQDVFLQVEAQIRTQKFNTLSRRHLEELLRTGNYTPVEQMAQALLDVAMTRYARTQ